MLQIPLKKSTPCDIVSPICKFVTSEYSQATSDEHLEEFRALQLLRNNAVEQSDINGRLNLLIYQGQLLHASSRLPVSTTGVNVSFTWHDAFVQGKQATQTSLAFERAAILFNLGALESYEGASGDRTTDDGLKKACKHFQVAAGYFDYVKNQIPEVALGMQTCDLTPSGCGLAINLMLAQAMACYYEMAVRKRAETKIKPSLLAKLAVHTALMFKNAQDCTESPAMQSQMDSSWSAHTKFQNLSFMAAAQYWQSQHVLSAAKEVGKGYAEEITRINMSLRACQEALAVAAANPSLTATQSLKDLTEKLNQNLATAVADNRTIYLEVEPAESSLAPIQGASPVKALPPTLTLTELSAANPTQDIPEPLLVNLLPVAALKVVEASKTRVIEFGESKDVGKRATRDARQHLASVGLPGSIASQNEGHIGLNENLWSRIKQTQELGGEWAIKTKLNELDQGAERAHEIMTKVKKSLSDEKRTSTVFMHSHPGVHIGNEDDEQFVKDLDHYNEIFRTARASDEGIRSEINGQGFAHTLQLLGTSRSALDAQFPRRDLLDDDSTKADTAQLSRELMSFASLLKSRDQNVTALITAVENYSDMLLSEVRSMADRGESLTVVNMGGSGPARPSDKLVQLISNSERQVQDIQQEVLASVTAQTAAMDKVLKENALFEAARSSDAVAVGRQRLTRELEQAITEFHDIHAKLTEGSAFYSDLVGRLMQVSQTVEGYVYAQSLTRRDVELSSSAVSNKASVEASDAALARRLAEVLQMTEGGTSPSSADSAPPPPPAFSAPPVPSRVGVSSSNSTPPPPPSYGAAMSGGHHSAAASRIANMGFPMDKVVAALKANNDDEEAALNSLLDM